jgi:tetratricopeptide (TPR) repeat protein
VGPAGPEKPGAPGAAEEPRESPRLQKLKQLQFDRRPSTMLRTWAKPQGEKPDEPTAKDGPLAKPDPIDEELAAFKRHVTLGNWADVKKYLAGLPADEGKAGYKHLLQALQGGGMGMPMQMPQMDQMAMMMRGGPMVPMQFGERNVYSADDILGLAAAAPKELDKDAIKSLGAILRQAIDVNLAIEHVVERLQAELKKPKDQAILTVRQSAALLAGADQAASAAPFLPSLEQAKKDKDHEALNLLARHYLGLHAKDKKLTRLEEAWAATQSVLALSTGPRAELEDALKRAVELAPKLKEELGQAWLEASFTKEPERGMDILATLGGVVAQGMMMQPMNPDQRLKTLQLQRTAVDALLKAAPTRAEDWRSTLTLLAGVWLKEAEFSHQFGRSTSLGPRMNRDRWGNIYYFGEDDPMWQMQMMRQQGMPMPVSPGDVLETQPSPAWVRLLDAGLKPKLSIMTAQLYLKVSEEEKAFPYIEQLSATHRDKARELASEFLRVWTKNHDPNVARSYTNPYMFMYGFERRSEGIPLTRSKQERNLVELAGWVARLRKLPIGELDEELLAKAFTSCHSQAEVYRMDAIETVFGPIGGLKPRTLAGLAQQMRENLGGVWRQPALQQEKKTNRKQKDIQAEVVRGYALAESVIDNALRKFPDDWSLLLAKAALLHDENNYQRELAKDSGFSGRREAAMQHFQQAARRYAAGAPSLTQDEESTKVYEQWFYASLGACDLQQVKEDHVPDVRQPGLIRQAILSLPGELAERHLGKFANQLFTRMSSASPAVKFRYLKAGFEIIREHKQAHEARKLHDYYKDLVTEIKLEAVIDGSDVVGHGQPFGVFVNLRHTKEIERESGGFGRFLQNQNSGMYWAYNYGRPTADYRDKFQTIATEALKEHFDVLSVTFQTDKVTSKATQQYGWRITPYAYLLLKAKGPQVDKLPSLRMDLDFLDLTGYVVLPVESPTVPLDAKPAVGHTRPVRQLQITQTLDERQAGQGKLLLEVKALGRGLVPRAEELLDFKPPGFDIVKTDDQGVSVSKYDEEADATAVVSERTILLTLRAKDGQAERPTTFRFAASRIDGAEMIYHRYEDADLATVTSEISLEQVYEGKGKRWMWWLIAAAGVVGVVGVGLLSWLLWPRKQVVPRFSLPDQLTPFTVLGFLRRIEAKNGFSEPQKHELRESIARVERHYFSSAGDGAVDLKRVAEEWLQRVK